MFFYGVWSMNQWSINQRNLYIENWILLDNRLFNFQCVDALKYTHSYIPNTEQQTQSVPDVCLFGFVE